jgi:hypothetical protein
VGLSERIDGKPHDDPSTQKEGGVMNLYYCQANGVFGRFGDYVWAKSRVDAELEFQNKHHSWPTSTRLERRAA